MQSFRRNTKSNHGNWWQDYRWKTAIMCNNNREAVKISVSSSCINDKYEYLVLPSEPSQMIEQAKFIYSPLKKCLKNKQKQFKIKENTSWSFKIFTTYIYNKYLKNYYQ